MTAQAGVRVLVVDDDDDVRRAIARVLGRAGHTVIQVADGHEALAVVDAGAIDVVLSDIGMPGVDGLHLLRSVRDRDLDLPVVLMTGSPTVASAAQAVTQGALDYLVKPFDPSVLDAAVRRAASLFAIAKMKREAFALLGRPAGDPGDRAGLEASFERALAGMWMAYQPIVRADGRTLFGYEALMRSTEPSLPNPLAVLDAAERLGRLGDLGRHVRAKTLEPLATADESACFFINLHPDDLLDESLYERGERLSEWARRIVLEITERASIGSVKDIRARVARLRELGFRIAIDDLGAGYAGLTSFADLEPEIVKLDMSLVRDVDKTPTKQKLIRSMAALCRDMGMLVVAEGVETTAERDVLVELGCDLLQGYLLAKPGRAFPPWSWGAPIA